jgi:hypothetical protein
MKRYKSFKAMGGGDIPQHHHQVEENYASTPISNIPLYDVPSHVQHGNNQYAHYEAAASRAIRNYGDSPGRNNYEYYTRDTPPHQPSQPRRSMIVDDDTEITITCKQIAEHIKKCKKCKKKYDQTSHVYMSIIMILILFTMFLLTKIADKF